MVSFLLSTPHQYTPSPSLGSSTATVKETETDWVTFRFPSIPLSASSEVRLRREYLYRKAQEDRLRTIEEKKQKLKGARRWDEKSCFILLHFENRLLPTEVRKDALQLQKLLSMIDEGAEGVSSHMDDEYKWAGVEDPKVMVTTSRDPSSRLKCFQEEETKINSLVRACKANNVTDLVIVHETRGQPDGLVVCHLPFGPTAYFTLYNVVMRHDVPDIGTMSEAYPHSSLTTSPLDGTRRTVGRVITFANQEDFISFRHHTYKKTDHRNIELTEVGPRFEMK
ncbi:U3 small nucleolar ribonucleoprotein protein IMP4-like, partial [Anoplopoma fimbria]|uniref:U3 small nucleolar ribonucleoprotein protein IMP4-like n=1 Tax=Anoplopoma fimbria TaxID=229290 RepID=UPI0023ECEEE0